MTYVRDPNAFDPTAYSREHSNCHVQGPDYFTITKATHPALFDVFEEISSDNGGGAGHDNYSVPVGMEPRAQNAETVLASMTPKERSTVASGEETDQQAVWARFPGNEDVDKFLNAFFEDWWEEDQDND